jgi:hypothetical protein
MRPPEQCRESAQLKGKIRWPFFPLSLPRPCPLASKKNNPVNPSQMRWGNSTRTGPRNVPRQRGAPQPLRLRCSPFSPPSVASSSSGACSMNVEFLKSPDGMDRIPAPQPIPASQHFLSTAPRPPSPPSPPCPSPVTGCRGAERRHCRKPAVRELTASMLAIIHVGGNT